jgi:photosystem II stability/assembly factor-like uncharacterized protein
VIEKGIKSSVESYVGRSTSVFASGRRGRIAATAAGLFFLFTVVALVQTRPGPGKSEQSWTASWWLSRAARSPALQQIQADLYDVYAVEGADGSVDVWAAGNLGLIVHSADGGWTWERQYPSADGAVTGASPSTPPAAATWIPPWQSIVAHAEDVGDAAINVEVSGEPSDVRNAEVRLVDVRSAQQIGSQIPDLKGSVRFAKLPVGSYRVQAYVGNVLSRSMRPPDIESQEIVVNEKQKEYYVSLLVGGTQDLLRGATAAEQSARQEPIQGVPLLIPGNGVIGGTQNAPNLPANIEPRTPPVDVPQATFVEPAPEPQPSHWRAISFSDPATGWAVDQNGATLSTSDGGKSWRVAVSNPDGLGIEATGSGLSVGRPLARAKFQKLWFRDRDSQGWGIEPSGVLQQLSQADGTGVPVSTDFAPRGLWFDIESDSPGGPYVCGADGALGRLSTDSSTGAVNFASQTSGTSADLNSIFFLPGGETGWAVGVDGTVIHTSDAGATWLLQTKGDLTDSAAESRRASTLAVAPWYYLSLLLVGFVLAPAFKSDPPVVTEQASVADKAVSDRPLRQGDPDPLELGEVARGLSRFLRNENTSPPLSVAVTGRWGTGKSSLMNLVRGDLSSFDYPTVWFNAWHHQKEDNLLAALLQNIRLQAVPSLLSWHGWMFRLRLYAIRGWGSWAPVLGLLAIAALSGGYFVKNMGGPVEMGSVARAWYLLSHVFGLLGGVANNEITESGSLLTTLAALYFMATTAGKRLSAFGLNPATLLRKASEGGQVRHLEQKTSFRYEFANEFRDVTRALGKYRLVLFVDDLDRCSEDTVVETLEAVNFLVSSGQCFVVMGLDRQYVECAVGLNFQKVAAEMAELSSETDDQAPQRQRQDFARQYLEKLVNIEVPVPVPDPENSRKLLSADKPEDTPREDELEKLRARFNVARQVAGIAAAMAVLVFSFYLGGNIPAPTPSEPLVEVIEPGPSANAELTVGEVAPVAVDTAATPAAPQIVIDTAGQVAAIAAAAETTDAGKYLGLWPLFPALFFSRWGYAGCSPGGPTWLCRIRRDLKLRFRFGIPWLRKSKIRRAPSNDISIGYVIWRCASARPRRLTLCGSVS